MTRDIKQIVKSQYAIPALEKAIGEAQSEIKAWLARVDSEPVYYLANCEDQFKNAATIAVLTEVSRMFRAAETDGHSAVAGELTLQEIRDDATKYMRRRNAVPHSTSATSNLMEQHILMAWMELANPEHSWEHNWISTARWADPEYQAAAEREYAIDRVHNAVTSARRKAIEKAERWAKSTLTRARNDGDYSKLNGRCCNRMDAPSCFFPYDAESIVDDIGVKELTESRLAAMFAS
jgi:hypothetical protein